MVSTELNVPNTENSFENVDENMVPDESSFKIDRITVDIPRFASILLYMSKRRLKKISKYFK